MSGKRKWWWLLYVAVAFAVLCAALVLFAPTIIVSVPYPTMTFDLSRLLGEKASALVSNRTARVDLDIRRGQMGGYSVRVSGTVLDWPFLAQASVRPAFRFLGVDLSGECEAWIEGSPWSLNAEFDASSSGEWRAKIDVPEIEVSESDPVLAHLLSRCQMPAISNLVFRGLFGLKAEGARTNGLPVAKWSAAGQLKDVGISCMAKGKAVEVTNLRMGFGASGIANHVDVRPMFPRADCVSVSGCVLTNVFASIRATETAYLVTEAGAGCCGGELKLYSFFLDAKRLSAGVTLFVDGVDAGDVLRLMKGFSGEASGKLYGKIPLRMKNGEELSLKSAYLHSTPGESGRLKVYDPKPVVENLALGGVPEATRANVAKALADLTYSVLRLSLQPEENGGMALTVKLAGSATHGGVTVPVSFEVTFHGDVEQLINTGLKTAMRKK